MVCRLDNRSQVTISLDSFFFSQLDHHQSIISAIEAFSLPLLLREIQGFDLRVWDIPGNTSIRSPDKFDWCLCDRSGNPQIIDSFISTERQPPIYFSIRNVFCSL